MTNPFSEKMARLPDVELIHILDQAEAYQQEAVEAVRHEIASRELSDDQLASLREALQHHKVEEAGLSRGQILLYLLLPWSPWAIYQGVYLHRHGPVRKRREMYTYLKMAAFLYLAGAFLWKARADGWLQF